MPKRKQKKRIKRKSRKDFKNDGKLTMKAQIFEGEKTIMKVKKVPLKKGMTDINFFAEKKLNIKKKRKKRITKKTRTKRRVKKKRK